MTTIAMACESSVNTEVTLQAQIITKDEQNTEYESRGQTRKY